MKEFRWEQSEGIRTNKTVQSINYLIETFVAFFVFFHNKETPNFNGAFKIK